MDFHQDVHESPPRWLNAMEERLSAVPVSAHKSESERAAHARRREQVRRAQRSHRERKEKYIKDIEAEVMRLRQHEAAHEEALQIHQENEMLKELLVAHNIKLPSNMSSHPRSPMSVSIFDLPDGSQDLRAIISPSSGHGLSIASPSEYSSGISPENLGSATSLAPVLGGPLETLMSTPHKAPSNGATLLLQHSSKDPRLSQQDGRDSSQLALDFVLGLEQPCLQHHRTHSFPDGETNGHVLMVQSPIMSRCPAPIPRDSKHEHLDTSCCWAAPTVEVEKLLTLSARLTLDGEITPVEAWRRITQHPGFQSLDKANIDALKEMILPEVMCYGFGAVVDEAYFEVMMQSYFSQFMSI